MLETNNTGIENIAFAVLLANWTWLRKQSLSLRTSQQKPSKLKSDQRQKHQNRVLKNCGMTAEGTTYVLWEHQMRKKRKVTEELSGTIMTEFPSNACQTPNHISGSSENTKNKKCQKHYT